MRLWLGFISLDNEERLGKPRFSALFPTAAIEPVGQFSALFLLAV
jgi:hypothetical protein